MSSEALNRFVSYIALPVLLFHAVARVEPAEIFNWRLIGGFVGSALFGMSSAFGNTV